MDDGGSEEPVPGGHPPPPDGGWAATYPPPAPRRPVGLLVAVTAGALVVGVIVGIAGWSLTVGSDDARVEEIGTQLCDAISGEARIVASGMVGFAIHQVEQLGKDPTALGDVMRDECPYLYDQLLD